MHGSSLNNNVSNSENKAPDGEMTVNKKKMQEVLMA
jgi:hypothetical protein